jgi:transposase InsO family protein
MSDVQYQLRALLPSLSAEARKITDVEVKKRYGPLSRIANSARSVAHACSREGKSASWFYKWAKVLLKKKTLMALLPKSRRPKRSPKQTPKRVTKRIRSLRKAEPFQGPERISQDLKDLYNIECAPSTVHNVLRREGLISREKAKRMTKKHLKRYRRPVLGYLQMDFKYVPYPIEGEQYYQLSCIDHHSSWRMIRAYPCKDTISVMRFLEELKEECPFDIIEIQTDNDAAFTDKYTSQKGENPSGGHPMDEWCDRHGIRHRLIPIGEKELNGKVENTHKQDDREHFSQIYPHTFKALAELTTLYNERWNERRKTKALGWKTPAEAVSEAMVRMLAWLLMLKERYQRESVPLVQITDTGLAYLPIPEVVPPKPKNRTPRKSAMRRYLEYLDWEEKTRKKA